MKIYCADCEKSYEWSSDWTIQMENRFMFNRCPICGGYRCEQ